MSRAPHTPHGVESAQPDPVAEVMHLLERGEQASEREEKRAAQRVRGIARRAPLALAHVAYVNDEATQDDLRRLTRTRKRRERYLKQQQVRLEQKAEEAARAANEALREAVRAEPWIEVS